MNKEIIVAHTKDHETIECPHCGIALCAHYPADGDTGEACDTTYYATGFGHICLLEPKAFRYFEGV